MVIPRRDVRRRRIGVAIVSASSLLIPITASADSLRPLPSDAVIQLRRHQATLPPHHRQSPYRDQTAVTDPRLESLPPASGTHQRASTATLPSSVAAVRPVSGQQSSSVAIRTVDGLPQNALRPIAPELPRATTPMAELAPMKLPANQGVSSRSKDPLAQSASVIHANRLLQMSAESLRGAQHRMRIGALHTASSLAMQSLRLAVEAGDARMGTNEKLQDLNEALNAIRESKDFFHSGRGDVQTIERLVSVHTTDVLKDRPLDDITRLRAAAAYLQHARSLLVSAADGNRVASGALIVLGHVEPATDTGNVAGSQTAPNLGLVSTNYHMAAAMISPSDAEVQKELGQTLARQGLLKQADQALRRSISIEPQTDSLKTLRQVALQRGDRALAQQCQQAMENPSLAKKIEVQQLSPREFAASYQPDKASIVKASQSIDRGERIAELPRRPEVEHESESSEKKRFSFRSLIPFGRR